MHIQVAKAMPFPLTISTISLLRQAYKPAVRRVFHFLGIRQDANPEHPEYLVNMSWRFTYSLLLLAFMLQSLCSPVLAWDDRYTQAKSGDWPGYHETEKKWTDSGSSPKPFRMERPAPPQFADVDLDENMDNKGKDYSPYAALRLLQDVKLKDAALTKGYYLLKAGHFGDGSLNSRQAQNIQYGGLSDKDKKKLPYQLFILKRQGKVITVVPIERIEPYPRQKKEKYPKKPLAWIEGEGDQRTLKFYYKKRLYISRLG